jgi:cytochrome P450
VHFRKEAGRWRAQHQITAAGHDIKTGQRVMVLLGSAGRDDNEIGEPMRLESTARHRRLS